MKNNVAPPDWAERLLRLLLPAADRDTISGDLLEAYREDMHPVRGRRRADWWYVRQVAWFCFRAVWLWGVLLAAAAIGRDTLDWWFSPANDFYARSVVSTYTAIAIYAGAGLAATRRSRSVAAGMLAGALTGAFAAVLIELDSLVLLAIRHDPHTLAMIDASGGLSEVFSLPVLIIVPGTLCAMMGAVAGRLWTSAVRRRPAA